MTARLFPQLENWVVEQVFVKKEQIRNLTFVQEGDSYLILIGRRGSDVECRSVQNGETGLHRARKIQTDKYGQSYVDNDNIRYYLTRLDKTKGNGKLVSMIKTLKTSPNMLYDTIIQKGASRRLSGEYIARVEKANSIAGERHSEAMKLLKSSFKEDLLLYCSAAQLHSLSYNLESINGIALAPDFEVSVVLEELTKFSLIPSRSNALKVSIYVHYGRSLCTRITEYVREGKKLSIERLFDKAIVYPKGDTTLTGFSNTPHTRRRQGHLI